MRSCGGAGASGRLPRPCYLRKRAGQLRDGHPGESGCSEPAGRFRPGRKQDADTVVVQPPGAEPQGLQARLIRPVRVIDDHEQRLRFRRGGEQVQARDTQGQRIRPRVAVDAQRALDRPPPRSRELIQPFGQQGRQDVQKAGVVQMRLGDQAQALLSDLAGAVLDASVAERIVAATGGNPLALEEAARRLSTEQLAGRAALPNPLPTPQTVQVAFEERLRRLPEATRAALVVAAVADSAPATVLVDALARLDLAAADLDGAERSGMIADGGAFAHPLMRTAALHTASARGRRLAHRALSAAWTDAGDSERAAWHLGAAVDGQDPAISEALAEAARAARARGATESAANAFRRAAETADDDAVRARLLFEAAFDLCRASQVAEALRLLDGLAESCPSSALRTEVDFLRGQALWASGRLEDAYAVLVEGADRSAASERAHAVTMLCTAAFTRAIAGNIGLCVRTAARAVELAREGSDVDRASAQFALGWSQILSGQGNQGYRRLRESVRTALPRDRLGGAAIRPPFGQLACWMEDYDTARQDLATAVAEARRHGAVRDLCYALAAIAELEFRTGDWLAACAHGTEALELSATTDLHSGYAGIEVGVLEAVTGNVARARELFESALVLGERTGTRSLPIYAHAGLGFLELGAGEPGQALRHLRTTGRLVCQTGLGEPNVVQWMPDLIETQVRLGRTMEAERELSGFEAAAARTGRRWALASASRCRGMLADSGDVDDVFADAQRLSRNVPSPFERARLELCWGERLRRDGRRVEARRHLGQALDEFEAFGATPWAERAAREIAASGARARRRSHVRSAELTAQETNVALLVAEGLTNKEVAARLFLSPKTVEFHLGNVFRKLDVRTRTQLVRVLEARAPAAAP